MISKKKVKVSKIAEKYGVDSHRFESFLRNRRLEVEDKFLGTYIEETLGNQYAKSYILVHQKADEAGVSFSSLDSYIQQVEGPSYRAFYKNIEEEKLNLYASKCMEEIQYRETSTNMLHSLKRILRGNRT